MKYQTIIRGMAIDYELVPGKAKKIRLEFKDGKLYLLAPHADIPHEKIIHRHGRWVCSRYARIEKIMVLAENIEPLTCRSADEFRNLVLSIAAKNGKELGVRPEKIGFRKMKTKWGSCNSKGNLNFNSYMRYLPDEMIEYIVYHEMVHLIELNHSSRFWDHIRRRFPCHDEYENMLMAYWALIRKKYLTYSL